MRGAARLRTNAELFAKVVFGTDLCDAQSEGDGPSLVEIGI